jgi:hypothetical protein
VMMENHNRAMSGREKNGVKKETKKP